MRKINTVKELVDFAYNKYKTKKAITIESDYIKNINYFNFRFDIYSMARVIKSKENQIRNNKIAIISEFRYEFLVTYLANIMVNNTVILIDNKLSKNTIEKVIKKHNINTIFFSSTYKEKILEIIKNNNCNNFSVLFVFATHTLLVQTQVYEKGVYSQWQATRVLCPRLRKP